MVAGPSSGPAVPPAQMSAPQWRQFSFFDVEEVEDSEDPTQNPRVLRDARPPFVLTATSPTSPLAPAVIMSSSTVITILDRHLAPERTFQAWDGDGKATALVEAGGLLIGIGEDNSSPYPVLKIWDLTRQEKKKAGGGPVLLRNVRIQHGQRPPPVSAVALTSNLSHLAIGLGDGTVLLYRHLLQSLTTSPTAIGSLPKPRVLHESLEPVTGLGFREPLPAGTASQSRAPESDRSNVSQLALYIVTTNRILCAPVSGRGGEIKTIDELGCGLGCAVLDWDRREMVMARDEAIYLYGPEGRGACYAYESPKHSISIYRQNLIITSPPFSPSASSTSATVRNYVNKNADSNAAGPSDISKVTVFDLQNKFIAYSGTFKEGVREIFCQWGGIFVFGSSGKLSRLDQHSTSAKLDVMYRRNLFTLAITLARSQSVAEGGVADIHRRYGDYLYGKGNYDGAMDQFIKTLGFLQPSYVIRKFLDAQRIHNLTTYLQELHSRGLANPDHTTLLLNCYTKTSDKTRLDAFIKTEAKRSDESGGSVDDLPFDLDTAIRVCRQAGFFEHATYLAKKYRRHEDYLRIQIEDAEQYDDALRYLRSLGPKACEVNMVLYGRRLLQSEPEATTDLLIDLCSGNLGRKPPDPPPSSDAEKAVNAPGSSGPAVLSYLGYNKVTELLSGDNRFASLVPPDIASAGSGDVQTGRSEGIAGDSKPIRAGAEPVADINLIPLPDTPSYIPPSPRQYFAHFVDHRVLFVRFLEAVAFRLWGQKADLLQLSHLTTAFIRGSNTARASDAALADQGAVWNTLLELYLASTKSANSDTAEVSRTKALGLLQSSMPFDSMHALILCSTSGFTDGLVRLWESMGMYEDVVRFWMEKDRSLQKLNRTNGSSDPSSDDARQPSEEVLRCLEMYGPENLHLYPLVLRYLTSSPEILSRHPAQLASLLETIDNEHIMPPLAVIQLLSRNNVASVGSVKGWLRQKVEDTKTDIEADQQLVQSYRGETAVKQKEIADLANTRQPEVFQVTRCAACGGQLDLPSVHFMCKHSYHQRCLSDSEPECVLCARQHSIIREVRRNQSRLADRHDLFLSEVHDAEDGFGVVAGAFGRGLMGKKIIGEL